MKTDNAFIYYGDMCLERDLFNYVKEGNLLEVKKIILEGANVNASIQYKFPNADLYSDKTPLMVAASEGNIQIVKELIASGADVNAKNVEDNENALQFACFGENDGGDIDVIKEFILSGIDVNSEDAYGWRVLDSLATNKNRGEWPRLNEKYDEIVELLQQAGAKHSEKYLREEGE